MKFLKGKGGEMCILYFVGKMDLKGATGTSQGGDELLDS